MGTAPSPDVTATVARRVTRQEWFANLGIVIIVPLIARLLAERLAPGAFALGFDMLWSAVSGGDGGSDIGWEVAASRGLLDAQASSYDPVSQLGLLIGMREPEMLAHSHPPTALPLGIPLALLPYTWWLGMWIVAMVCLTALAMRILAVPMWVAYPVALAISVTRPGQNMLMGTYPLMAFVLAVAWARRDSPGRFGIALAVLAATRGFAGILLLYPLLRRQWRTVFIAVATLVALMVVALAFEFDVVQRFFEAAQATIRYNLSRYDLLTPSALFEHFGIPTFLWVLIALVVTVVALARRQSLFWSIAWLSFAVTTIAWPQSVIMGLPLAVMFWKAGGAGPILVILGAIPVVAFSTQLNVSWPVFILLSGVALVTVRIPGDEFNLRGSGARLARLRPADT
jgi:hypothetical protein